MTVQMMLVPMRMKVAVTDHSPSEWEEYWEEIARLDLPTQLDALRRVEAELSARLESGGPRGETAQN